MESLRDKHESKKFRWVGRPSEEELLGLPAPVPRHARVSFQPLHTPGPSRVAAPQPHVQPRRHDHPRDVVAIAAVAAAAWFAWQGAGTSLPFFAEKPAAPAELAEVDGAQAALTDRLELGSLPRSAARTHLGSTPFGSSGGRGSSGSGPKDDPKTPPPDETAEPPLVQATIPGIGSVTIEDPGVPLPVEAPTVPDSGDLLSRTPTLPLT